MNTGAPWPGLDEAEARVRAMQTKLHCWATADTDRRFDDLFARDAIPISLSVDGCVSRMTNTGLCQPAPARRLRDVPTAPDEVLPHPPNARRCCVTGPAGQQRAQNSRGSIRARGMRRTLADPPHTLSAVQLLHSARPAFGGGIQRRSHGGAGP